MNVKNRVSDSYDELVKIRRDFHRYPELGTKEVRTSKKICEYLEKWGIEYQAGVADTGVVGIIRGKEDGATVAIRADIDALPITEDNAKEYASTINGVMHACGHDVHTTILLGAGKILKEMEHKLQGNVKLFFQPAEESVGGAERMITSGCLENPKVDYVIGLHVMPNVPVGMVELKYGKLNGNTGSVSIVIKGRLGHAAYPDKAVDAIAIAGYTITSLQTLVSRNVSPLESVVLTIGKINGGEKSNIIADKVTLEGTLRTLDSGSREKAKEIITQICQNTALALGGSAEVSFSDGYIALINNDTVVDIIKGAATEVVGEKNIVFKEFPSMGGEDFSYFIESVPGAFYHLGCGNAEKGIDAPLHTSNFDVDEDCIKIGVEIQVMSVLKLMGF